MDREGDALTLSREADKGVWSLVPKVGQEHRASLR